MSTEGPTKQEELVRIDFSGTIWFSAALIASAVTLSGLLSTGWRPAALPQLEEVLWWIGAALVVIGIGSLAWAGCPVLGGPLPREFKWKARAIRAGLAVFAIGALLAVMVTLAAPA